MKKLFIVLLLVPALVAAQSPFYDSTKALTPVSAYGNAVKNLKVQGQFTPAIDTFKMAVRDSGSIATKNNNLYVWNGYKWVLSSGSGGTYVNTDNLDSVLTRGGAVTGTKTIDASTGTLVFDGSNYLAPGLGTGTKTDSLLTIRVTDGKIRKLGYKGFGLITQTDADGLYGSLAQQNANTAAIQQRIDSLRNNAGVLEARKGGVFVPQFTLPSATNIYVSDGTLTSNRTLNSSIYRLIFNGGFEQYSNAQLGLTLQGSATNKDIYFNLKNTNGSGKEYSLRSLTTGEFEILNYTNLRTFFSYNDVANSTTLRAANFLKSDNSFAVGTPSTGLYGLWLNQSSYSSTNYVIASDGTFASINAPNSSGYINFAINNTIRAQLVSNGNLLIGTTTDIPSSKLTLNSTTQGFLPPRLTATQASSLVATLTTTDEGLMFYVNSTNGTFTTKGWYGWNGAAIEKLNN